MEIEMELEMGVGRDRGRDRDRDRDGGRGRVPVSLERSWPTIGAVSTCDDMMGVVVGQVERGESKERVGGTEG
jgi:hypothetical protein